ncbi:Ser-Thr-rich glycosyl-phosphatidyl-inositol-anchored membrane family-domain-containing protein [Lasiosphaeria miniovina]|uniref:Ser-Thr-rich glycosyl-phosphatidyl-inositol-anchored membrane family-domain-containing protein n=1 Tax=Lasiosphaeria miniovina TaxID=1954250 RepID=A0AA40BIL1_9PEZI|nr:Ser-Thr-rich glycosyl-phosphatidyl-inositol-anchored membrane family-domain-containing protein [Lasiosphaeria miniovina]KAK0734892.1 Ser-Thr-rich glycosyl-phosphatidyl-inositol-anchored membrane family-domain-containing protein [Lasiosphaeria miniovina]
MHFSIATTVAFASAVLAQKLPTPGFDAISRPTKGEKIPAGSSYKIVWEPSTVHTGPIAIDLLGGPTPGLLNVVNSIAAGVDQTAGTFSWAVGKELGALATYGIQISLESNTSIFQWGNPFEITGGVIGTTSTTSAGSTASTTTTTSKSTSLSSASTTALATTDSTTVTTPPSSTLLTTSSAPPSNLSTTRTTATNVLTTGGSTKTSSTSAPTNTSGATSFFVSSLALFGGLSLAIFSL